MKSYYMRPICGVCSWMDLENMGRDKTRMCRKGGGNQIVETSRSGLSNLLDLLANKTSVGKV